MATVGKLDSYFTSLISDLMLLERQPLTRLQTQKDTLSLRTTVYNDVKTKLSGLQSAVKALISTSATNALSTGRTVAISNVTSGSTVLAASASSDAIPGTYAVHVNSLAKEHRIRSKQMTYSDQSLGLAAGAILLGGAADRSASTQAAITNTVSSFGAGSAIDTGQLELGTGTYFVETRQDDSGSWQFRVVDAEGSPVSVKQGGSTSTFYTSDWQSIPAGGGMYDTGRGLAINFGTDSASYASGNRSLNTAAAVDYTAKGVQIQIDDKDSLNTIAAHFNDAVFAEGMGISATVVDNMLVLSARSTGVAHKILASDMNGGTVLSSLGILRSGDASPDDVDASDNFQYTMQVASNASFTVNSVLVTRSQNNSLTNVISGVSLSLAPDAQGKDATLSVSADWSSARSAVDAFITKFNEVQSYLAAKTSVDSTTVNGQTTYTRGALADDNIFSELRGDLFYDFMTNDSTGALQSLRDIGITLDDNLQANVSDSARLETALSGNFSNVKTLLDQVMGSIDAKLSRFAGTTGETGYLDNALTGITSEAKDVSDEITEMNEYLAEREQYLTDQYAEIQAQLMTLSYSQQMWSSIYGTTSKLV